MSSFRLGLIAAGGTLPRQVLKSCQEKEIPVTIIAFKGITSPTLEQEFPASEKEGRSWYWISMGQFSKAIRAWKSSGVTKITLVGGLKRPSIRHMRMGLRDFLLFQRFARNVWHGDDSLLSSIIKGIERYGFEVIGVQDVVDQLLAPLGVLGSVQPFEKAQKDIKRGVEVAKTLGQVDVGQAVVIQDGVVLGVEGIEGTNSLIDRCSTLKMDQKQKPILVKVCKPQQDKRIDLPTIGPETIDKLHKANFAGVVVEANKTLILDIDEVIKKANAYKIFVVGITSVFPER